MQIQRIPIPIKGQVTDPVAGQASAASLEGLWYHLGRLRSMEGRQMLSGLPKAVGVNDTTFGNHVVYHSTATARPYVIARYGNHIWLGVEGSSTVVTSTASTITVQTGDGADFPFISSLLLQGEYVVTYTGRTGDQFTGCSTLPTLAAGDSVYWIDWRPLWGDSSAAVGYPARTASTNDDFLQINDVLYFGGGGVPGRWSGFEFHTGTVTSGYGGANPTRVTFSAVTANTIQQGDTIYFRYETGGVSQWDMANGCVVQAARNDYLTCYSNIPDFTGKGIGGGNAVEYQVVRTSQMGVPACPEAATTALASGGTLATGTYRYYWRYVSSNTGYKGSMLAPAYPNDNAIAVDAGTANRSVVVDGLWTLPPPEPHVTAVEIWRSTITGGEESALEIRATLSYTTTGTIADTWTDTGAAYIDPPTLEADYLYYTRPGTADVGAFLYYWQDRIVTYDSAHPNAFRFSTQGDYEYWPVEASGAYGGYFYITNSAADPIVDIVGEGGSYAQTGRVGGALLIASRTGLHRLSGSSWSTFAIDKIAEVGAVARTMQNGFGASTLMSQDGPVLLPIGSLTPQPIYTKLWPRGMRLDLGVTSSVLLSYLEDSKAFLYGEWWGLQVYNGTTYTLYMYHIPTDTWTTIPLSSQIQSFALWNGSLDSGQITATDGSGLWRLFTSSGATGDPRGRHTTWNPKHAALWPTGPTGQATEWITDPAYPMSPNNFTRYAKLVSVKMRFRRPAAAQTVTLAVYADGNLTTPQWTGTATLTADASLTGQRDNVTWYPIGGRGTQFQFKVSGTFTTPVEIEDGLELAYIPQERVK